MSSLITGPSSDYQAEPNGGEHHVLHSPTSHLLSCTLPVNHAAFRVESRSSMWLTKHSHIHVEYVLVEISLAVPAGFTVNECTPLALAAPLYLGSANCQCHISILYIDIVNWYDETKRGTIRSLYNPKRTMWHIQYIFLTLKCE